MILMNTFRYGSLEIFFVSTLIIKINVEGRSSYPWLNFVLSISPQRSKVSECYVIYINNTFELITTILIVTLISNFIQCTDRMKQGNVLTVRRCPMRQRQKFSRFRLMHKSIEIMEPLGLSAQKWSSFVSASSSVFCRGALTPHRRTYAVREKAEGGAFIQQSDQFNWNSDWSVWRPLRNRWASAGVRRHWTRK